MPRIRFLALSLLLGTPLFADKYDRYVPPNETAGQREIRELEEKHDRERDKKSSYTPPETRSDFKFLDPKTESPRMNSKEETLEEWEAARAARDKARAADLAWYADKNKARATFNALVTGGDEIPLHTLEQMADNCLRSENKCFGDFSVQRLLSEKEDSLQFAEDFTRKLLQRSTKNDELDLYAERAYSRLMYLAVVRGRRDEAEQVLRAWAQLQSVDTSFTGPTTLNVPDRGLGWPVIAAYLMASTDNIKTNLKAQVLARVTMEISSALEWEKYLPCFQTAYERAWGVVLSNMKRTLGPRPRPPAHFLASYVRSEKTAQTLLWQSTTFAFMATASEAERQRVKLSFEERLKEESRWGVNRYGHTMGVESLEKDELNSADTRPMFRTINPAWVGIIADAAMRTSYSGFTLWCRQVREARRWGELPGEPGAGTVTAITELFRLLEVQTPKASQFPHWQEELQRTICSRADLNLGEVADRHDREQAAAPTTATAVELNPLNQNADHAITATPAQARVRQRLLERAQRAFDAALKDGVGISSGLMNQFAEGCLAPDNSQVGDIYVRELLRSKDRAPLQLAEDISLNLLSHIGEYKSPETFLDEYLDENYARLLCLAAIRQLPKRATMHLRDWDRLHDYCDNLRTTSRSPTVKSSNRFLGLPVIAAVMVADNGDQPNSRTKVLARVVTKITEKLLEGNGRPESKPTDKALFDLPAWSTCALYGAICRHPEYFVDREVVTYYCTLAKQAKTYPPKLVDPALVRREIQPGDTVAGSQWDFGDINVEWLGIIADVAHPPASFAKFPIWCRKVRELRRSGELAGEPGPGAESAITELLSVFAQENISEEASCPHWREELQRTIGPWANLAASAAADKHDTEEEQKNRAATPLK